MSTHVNIPSAGAKITSEQGVLTVPNNPIIPFIEGDGIGVEIINEAVKVLDAVAKKCNFNLEYKEYLEKHRVEFINNQGIELIENLFDKKSGEDYEEFKTRIKQISKIIIGKVHFRGYDENNEILEISIDYKDCIEEFHFHPNTSLIESKIKISKNDKDALLKKYETDHADLICHVIKVNPEQKYIEVENFLIDNYFINTRI